MYLATKAAVNEKTLFEKLTKKNTKKQTNKQTNKLTKKRTNQKKKKPNKQKRTRKEKNTRTSVYAITFLSVLGKVYVEFANPVECAKAQQFLSGRKFANRVVITSYYEKEKYHQRMF